MLKTDTLKIILNKKYKKKYAIDFKRNKRQQVDYSRNGW